MKLTISIIALAVATSSAAFAGGHLSKQEIAQQMVTAIKVFGAGNNSGLKDALGLEGNGGVASYVSGKKSANKNGGWGNVGSAIATDYLDGGLPLDGSGQSLSGR